MYTLRIAIKLAIKNLRSNVARTALTLLGVVIGIASVILVTSAGNGVKSFILGQVESFGDDTMQVEVKVPSIGKNSPSNATSQAMGVQITTLKVADATAIAKLPNVMAVYAGSIGQELVSYMGTNKRSLLFGAGAQAPLVDLNIKLSDGVFYDEGQDSSLEQVIVIGSGVKEALFGSGQAVGQEVRIKGQNYKVIGVLEPRGAVAFFNFDDIIYVPVRTLQKKILGVDYVRMMTVRVKDKSMIDVTEADINDLMRYRHHIINSDTTGLKDDFSVTTIEKAKQDIQTIFATLNILLLALTSISLVVGGVGIMNVMYVAVTERTFEIGLRKAIGARAKDILTQFLWEAIFITFIGGLIGIILGFILTKLMNFLFGYLGYDLNFSLVGSSVLLAVSFSVITGIIFGYYPARAASRLTPMEALRRD